MKIFQNSFFKSKDDSVENLYRQGVLHLKANDYYAADRSLRKAADAGHVSALYNSFLLNGGGFISPYDIDLAADCFYKAAKAEHPSASKNLFMLAAADRGGFGADNLTHLASSIPPQDGLSALLMVCAARFFHAVAEAHEATSAVIAHELNAASYSENRGVLNFVHRTGVPDSFYNGPLSKLEEGGAADQITDGLEGLSHALRSAGHAPEICAMVRCSIVGYIVSKSPHGKKSKPLLGLDKFFN
jgi:TPR repeat protein